MVDLTVQCPHCATRFQASLEQLQLRKGVIRCLHCAHIFDGYEEVVAPDAPAAPVSPTPAMPVATAAPSVLRRRGEFSISDGESHSLGPVEPRVPRPEAPVTPPAPAPGPAHPPLPADPSDTLPVDRWGTVMRGIWLLLIAAGLLVLAVQLAYVFRVQLAAQWPQARPWLERLCAPLHCQVAYARHPELIVITHSSLQRHKEEPVAPADEAQEVARYVLELTLRNAHGQPQEWPNLVLDLKDAAGAMIARRILPAGDYLPAAVAAAPFPGESERRIHLPLALHGLKVNGYQLTTYFP